MNALVRETGRWVKRKRLSALRSIKRDKIHYNTLLNQKEILQGRVRLESFPRMIQVGTNWTCNLKCFFCRRETTDVERLAALPSDELQIADSTMERLVEALPYTEVFNLTPLGEPLMYSGLPKFLERYRAMDCLNLQMTTNNNVTTDSRARMLVESRVRRLFVSVDSADPVMYAQMRTGGNLDKVSEGFENINAWKARLNLEYPEIVMASTFMRRNIEDLPGLVEYAHLHKVETISVQLMEPEDESMEPETLTHHVPITIQALRAGMRIADRLGVRLQIHLALRSVISAHAEEPGAAELLADQPAIDIRGTTLMQKCDYPWTFMVVDTDSDARPCCWAGISYGNLAEQTFDEIWNGPINQRMRRDFLNNHIPESCRGKHCRVDL